LDFDVPSDLEVSFCGSDDSDSDIENKKTTKNNSDQFIV